LTLCTKPSDGRPARAERAAVDGVVGIAFDVDDLGLAVLGVGRRVDQDAAGHRAVGAGVAGLRRFFEPEGPDARGEHIARLQEPEGAHGRGGEASGAHLHELPT